MVKVWYMSEQVEDPQAENHLEPAKFIELHELHSTSGVLYWKIKPEDESLLEKIKQERGYSYEDAIEISPDKLPNYEEKLKIFFSEHLHTDEEIRFVLEGSGYFDVRDKNDRWIRIHVTKGDLLVLPAGIYHRFTLDSNNYIKAKRFFVGEPVWTPHNRPADEMDARKEYLVSLQRGFSV